MNTSITTGWLTQRDPRGPVTCAVCGCRLAEAHGLEGTAWRHFQLRPDTDARGCRPTCLENLHDRHGDVIQVRSLEALMAADSGPAAPA